MSGELRYAPFFGCMISVKYPQFEAAVRKTMSRLGVELVDLEGFTCCPDPIFFKATDKLTWLTLAARNLCLAERAGLDLVTCCSGCTATLSETRHTLAEEPELKARVNARLAAVGLEYRGSARVRHVVTVLRDDVGLERVSASAVRPLAGLRVAVHYGCHVLKPRRVMNVDDPDNPTILENLLRAVGAEPVEHDERVLCCGKACMNEEVPLRMMTEILESVGRIGVDCIGLICPTCFDEYDLGQIRLSRTLGRKFQTPAIYYFQLLALAQGMSPAEVGLQFHKIKADPVLAKIGAGAVAAAAAG